MGNFYVFQIVQMVPNRATHHNYSNQSLMIKLKFILCWDKMKSYKLNERHWEVYFLLQRFINFFDWLKCSFSCKTQWCLLCTCICANINHYSSPMAQSTLNHFQSFQRRIYLLLFTWWWKIEEYDKSSRC